MTDFIKEPKKYGEAEIVDITSDLQELAERLDNLGTPHRIIRIPNIYMSCSNREQFLHMVGLLNPNGTNKVEPRYDDYSTQVEETFQSGMRFSVMCSNRDLRDIEVEPETPKVYDPKLAAEVKDAIDKKCHSAPQVTENK